MALRILPATICLLLALSSHATAQQSSTEETAFADVQKHFAEAHNHKDVDAMAAAFTENGVRVTPSGIFQGRDAIRRNLQDALDMGLLRLEIRVCRRSASLSFVARMEPTGPARSGRPDDRLREIRERSASLNAGPGCR
jgi:hypothetical protein